MDIAQAAKELKKIHQEHVLRWYEDVSEPQQRQLLGQIGELSFSKIPQWVQQYVKGPGAIQLPESFEPAPAYPAQPGPRQAKKYAEAVELGQNLIRSGEVAGFVVAGGQGTRLGFDGPKGNFPISPVRKKTLFQIFAETLLAASRKYGARIPFYIMTSPLNYQATVEIFENAGCYGMDKADIVIFQQGTLPNFGFDGRILMADKGRIATSPDGHGGSLKALYVSGAVEDMRRRRVEYLSYWQVDNPLVKLIDPLFIGLHALDRAEMSSKALKKAGPLEKVGNFCLVNGKITVIEYSDLPDAAAMRKNADGSLAIDMGSIGIHLINRSFIERLNAGGDFLLPLHKAVKKIPCLDEQGKAVHPDTPNGVKLETFVFDALPLASNSIILETLRQEEFSPVKNAAGADSAEVTHRMMIERAAGWLEAAGLSVPRTADGTVDCALEIAPDFALSPEEISARKDKIPPIKPGGKVYLG
ncbi:MAG: UDPGP type 1 family protein [Planctomycetaceae bacterium]|nr:UDPGP type 1 family protein [Planctomycetaceae bacterium]